MNIWIIRRRWLSCLAGALALVSANGHNGDQPSLHDTVAGVKARLRKELSPQDLAALTEKSALAALTEEERRVLATGALRFRVSAPARVRVVAREAPFWLSERGFAEEKVNISIAEEELELGMWTKEFPAGEIRLGANSLRRSSGHYAIALEPVEPEGELAVSDLYPGQLTVARWEDKTSLFADRDVLVASPPEALQGRIMVQTLHGARNDAVLEGVFRLTEHPASSALDQIALTWSDDPRVTQTIQWRASAGVLRGVVAYQKKSVFNRFQPAPRRHVEAARLVLEDETLANDPRVHRFTATLTDLEPGETYVYSVGNGLPDGWSELAEFTTAPDRVVPFSFVYMGDAQNGLDRWGTLVHNAFRERPDAAFYVMAGDLVDRGQQRDDWDSFFYNARGIFDRRQLVPAIGNHENQGGHPGLYLKNFTLPTNGPSEVEAERCYSFEYSNALFVILDTNLKPETQAAWLDRVLGESSATWKFAVYHHPAYSSAPNRDNPGVREHWLPIFDKHHVDMALQGHDHAYLRTHPMKGGERVAAAKDGTIYVVSVSGTKMYGQQERDETALGFTKIATYQVLDLQVAGDRLLYRAYDIDGRLRDEVEIVK